MSKRVAQEKHQKGAQQAILLHTAGVKVESKQDPKSRTPMLDENIPHGADSGTV